MTDTERQLKAIMFSDVKSFSAMMAADEERTMRLIKEHREIVRKILAKYDGEEHGTAGDSFFVLFSSAVNAVRCAVEIQETFHKRNAEQPDEEQIWIRIGIHIGDIIVDANDNHVYGEGINIAARTEPQAEPGGICITQDVFKQVKNKIDLKVISIGRQEMKNIVDAPELYRIIVGQMGGEGASPSDTTGRYSGTRLPRFRAKLLVGLLLLAAVVVGAIFALLQPGTEPTADEETTLRPIPTPDGKAVLVVLPFDNVTGNAADDWLGIGFAEQVQSKLTAVDGVTIVPYRNLGKIADKATAIAKAREAGATTAVTGSFQKVGEQIRITAHAEDLAAGDVLGEAIEQRGTMSAIFDLQDAVAVSLAQKLRGQVGEEVKKEIEKQGTRNLEAFEAYSKGVALLSVDKVLEALIEFNRAIAADPKYRTAQASISEVRMMAEEVAIDEDGSVRITAAVELPHSPDGARFSRIGDIHITRAWDFAGNPLEVTETQISKKEWAHQIQIPLPRDEHQPFGVVYEDLTPAVKGREADGLWFVQYSFTFSGFEDRTFLVRLPKGARLLSALPTPASASREKLGTLLLLRQARRPGVNIYWGVVYATDPKVAARFTSLNPKERVDWIERASRGLPRSMSKNLAHAVESSRLCLAALQGDSAEVDRMLQQVNAAEEELGPALVAHARACAARAAGNNEQAFKHLEAAVHAGDRPWELIQELYFEIVDVAATMDDIAAMEKLVRGELESRNWWTEELFHTSLPAGSEEAELRQLIEQHPENMATRRDLALVLHRSGRNTEAETIMREDKHWLDNIYLCALGARVIAAQGKKDEAIDAYRSLVRLYPLSGAWTTHVTLLAQAGQAIDALRMLEKRVEKRDMYQMDVDCLKEILQHLAHPMDQLESVLGLVGKCKVVEYSVGFRLRSLAQLTEAATRSTSQQRDEFVEALLKELRRMAAVIEFEDCDASCLALQHNKIAWTLATTAVHDEELLRLALSFAERAVTATDRKILGYLDTLAEVYERMGDLENAKKINDEGLALAPKEKMFLERKKRLDEGKPHGKE